MSRVSSKNLFNFSPAGELDSDVAEFEAKMVAMTGTAESGLSSLRVDDPEAVSKLIGLLRPMMAAMGPSISEIPIYKQGIEACNHTQFHVETSHAGQFDVPVHVHTPKTLCREVDGSVTSQLPPAAIIYAHGGGAVAADATAYKPVLSAMAVNCGVVVFNVDYRLAPETKCPDNIKDFYSVVKHISANARQLGVDPARLAISGESGGGYICFGAMVMLAQAGETDLVKLAIPNIPMISDYCFSNMASMTQEERKSAACQRVIWKAIARDLDTQCNDPLLYPAVASDELLSKFPPTAMVDTEFDHYITEASRMAARLRRVGRLLEFAVIPGTLHGYSLMVPTLKCAETERDVFQQIVKHYLL